MKTTVTDQNRDAQTSPRVVQKAFVAICLCLLVVPLVFIPFVQQNETSEKRELAPAPVLMTEEGPSYYVLSDAGDYLSDHFAFRSQLVDLDATLKQHLFGTSTVPNVVVGQKGWLYYAGTLNDYQRKNSLSEQALKNIVRNLSLTQEYFQVRGKNFVLAIAPNKNELYPQEMPYYELKGEGPSNVERLMPLLDEAGVTYADLHSLFRAHDEVLYFDRDSHWNDYGAYLAYSDIMAKLNHAAMSLDTSKSVEDMHIGDVDAMLHPNFATGEAQQRNEGVDAYRVTNDAKSVEENYIITEAASGQASGKLIMYRDSFGNNLMQPFASSYTQAVFTKLVPYDMGLQMTGFADDVVVERTERHLSFFATDPPYLPALKRNIELTAEEVKSDTTVFVEENGPYTVVEGTLDAAAASPDDHVYVQIRCGDGSAVTFESFRVSERATSSEDFEGQSDVENSHISGDNGYITYILTDMLRDQDVESVHVLVGNGNGMTDVGQIEISR